MLSDRELELLTAYVDGELSDRQQRHAERLLRASEEARALLRDLQADSRHLIELPKVNAPAELHRSIMSAVGKVKRQPAAARARPDVRTFPAWTGWAAAAAVLLVIGVGTFVSYSRNGSNAPVVRKDKTARDGGPGRDSDIVKNDSETDKSKDREETSRRTPDDEPTVPDREPTKDTGKPKPINRPKPELPPLVFGDGSREGNIRLERV